MTNNQPTETITIAQAIKKSALGLAIFAFFTAGIIAITQVVTENKIEQNQKAFEARVLLSLLPDTLSAEQLLDSAQTFEQEGIIDLEKLAIKNTDRFYQQVNEDSVEAVILPVVAPEGYTEAIRLIVGIDPAGNIIGVRVTQHKETPGLGDQVETAKSDWIYAFNDSSLNQPMPSQWAVKKDGGDFDQLTGATITPRAIVKAVKNSLEFFEANQAVLLTPRGVEQNDG
jgi:electron transport complex protein RnfG